MRNEGSRARNRLISVLSFLLSFASGSGLAQSFAYVTNHFVNTVSVVDVSPDSADFNQVIATIDVGINPLAVAITPNGKRAYVVNQSFFGMDGTVSVIDADSESLGFNTVLTTIAVGMNPAAVAITPGGKRAYVVNQSFPFGSLSVIDTDPASASFHTVIDTINLESEFGPSAIAIIPDGTRAYVTNQFSGSVSVIDIQAESPTFHTVIDTIPIDFGLFAIAIHPNGTRAYVANRFFDFISVIDTDPDSAGFNQVIGQVDLVPGAAPSGLALTPDGSRAYVANFGSDAVSVINTSSNTETLVIAADDNPFVEIAPYGVAVAADGKRVYVTSFFGLFASVIDSDPASPDFHTVTAVVDAGAASSGIAIQSAVSALTIDIKPGSDPNSINPDSKALIAVAVLTTPTFDAATIDPGTVQFGPSGALEAHGRGHWEDVDQDGDPDLVLHFRIQESGIQCGDASASLTGQTLDGQAIQGSDLLQTVGCP